MNCLFHGTVYLLIFSSNHYYYYSRILLLIFPISSLNQSGNSTTLSNIGNSHKPASNGNAVLNNSMKLNNNNSNGSINDTHNRTFNIDEVSWTLLLLSPFSMIHKLVQIIIYYCEILSDCKDIDLMKPLLVWIPQTLCEISLSIGSKDQFFFFFLAKSVVRPTFTHKKIERKNPICYW